MKSSLNLFPFLIKKKVKNSNKSNKQTEPSTHVSQTKTSKQKKFQRGKIPVGKKAK